MIVDPCLFFVIFYIDSRKISTSRDVQIQGVGVPGFFIVIFIV